MQHKPIHIISFDNPYPPVYGGAIDVFYKIKALHALGFEIYLHCFVDQLPDDRSVLEQYVSQLYFYERKKKGLRLFSRAPFSVASRFHDSVLANIAKIKAPLLFEGLQSTYLLKKCNANRQKVFLRLMNLESNYFGGLAKSEKGLVKKLALHVEAVKYRYYQKIIGKFDSVFTLSVHETDYVAKHFGNAVYVPVFHGNTVVLELSEFGNYALYHGDLRMSDNRRAALFLINVFKEIPNYKLIIASNRGKRLINKEIAGFKNISHTNIKNQEHLDELMANAHISVMYSFQQSGTKLKSINSLYKSRHCIINKNMVDDTTIQNLCTMAETASDFIQVINQLKAAPYTDYENRKAVLGKVVDDLENAKKIAAVILK